MKKFSIIMPLKINELNSFKIFSEISLPLYSKFLNCEELDYFYIICPLSDITPLQKYTRIYPNIPFKYIDENILISSNIHNLEGWYKQQIIKLTISLILETKYYLVVDSDMYLKQPLSYDDLFDNSKIKYCFEPWQELNNKYFSTNSKWWLNSANILKFDITKLYNQNFLMGVTPQVLIVDEVRSLINYLNSIYGSDWQKIICEMKFTEYTLYWIYLIMKEKTNLYTIDGYSLWKHDLERNILYYDTEENMKNIVQKSIEDKKSYFSVIQSYLPVNIDAMKNIIFKNVKISYSAIFLVASMTCPNRYQAFQRNERRQQITDTLNSIKQKVPNSICILIEGSNLTDFEKYEYRRHYDIVLELGNDKSIYQYINHPKNIGHGELKLLERGIEYAVKNILNVVDISYIFKLTARYKLTDKFDILNYVKDKYCFRPHIDISINNKVFTTGLYSIPINDIEYYKKILIEGQNVLSNGCNMVERMYVEMIPDEKIHLLENLGVEGMLSYNKTYFNL